VKLNKVFLLLIPNARGQPNRHRIPVQKDGSAAVSEDYFALKVLVVALAALAFLPLLDPDRSSHGSLSEMSPNFKSQSMLAFTVDWHDPTSEVTRSFTLNFFPSDNSVEMYDLKHRRLFLSRLRVDSVKLQDFQLGHTVVILSRRLLIKEYANEETRAHLELADEATFAMVKPDAVNGIGLIVAKAEDAGFVIKQIKLTHLSRIQVGLRLD